MQLWSNTSFHAFDMFPSSIFPCIFLLFVSQNAHTHTHCVHTFHLRLLAAITASGFERLHSHHRKINSYKISLPRRGLRRLTHPSSRLSQTADIISRSIRIRSQTWDGMEFRLVPFCSIFDVGANEAAFEMKKMRRENKNTRISIRRTDDGS